MTDAHDVERDKMLHRMALDADARLLATLAATIYAGYLAHPRDRTQLRPPPSHDAMLDEALADAITLWQRAARAVDAADEQPANPPP